MRFHISPRCAPAAIVARRLGVTKPQFVQLEPRLRQAGFPAPDPITSNYDLKAVEAYLDRKAGLGIDRLAATDAADGFAERLASIG